MVIQYFGQSCFKLKFKDINAFIDPYDPKVVGKSYPKQDDVALVMTSHGHPDHHYIEQVTSQYFHIDGPGEYDVHNIGVNGIFSFHDGKKGQERGINTIYLIHMEGINFCHLGDLGTTLSDEQIEKIGAVDVLFVPVGGTYTIDASDAAKVISQIEPGMVIPMHYSILGNAVNQKLGLESVDVFLKEMGVEKETVKTLKVTKDDFTDTTEGPKVIVME